MDGWQPLGVFGGADFALLHVPTTTTIPTKSTIVSIRFVAYHDAKLPSDSFPAIRMHLARRWERYRDDGLTQDEIIIATIRDVLMLNLSPTTHELSSDFISPKPSDYTFDVEVVVDCITRTLVIRSWRIGTAGSLPSIVGVADSLSLTKTVAPIPLTLAAAVFTHICLSP